MNTYGMRPGGGAGEWILGAVTRNPEGLLLLAAGAALLMRSGRSQSGRRSYAETFPGGQEGRQRSASREHSATGVGERISEATRRAGEYVSETTDKVSETARSYASSAAEYADEAASIAAERSRRVADQARETTDYIVREQPWAVALAGLVAGATVAAVFPSTRIERRTLGDVGQRLRSAAGTMGEQLMEAGVQAGERLSEVAEERGLTKEGLRDAARDVGETFSSALTGEEAGSAQASNRQQSGAGAASRTQSGEAQPGGKGPQSGSASSGKSSRPPGGPSGPTHSGGRK
jgi:hypothetical protein